jgi:hypothetical protein
MEPRDADLLRCAATILERGPQWESIETAPRDGASILLYDHGVTIGRFEAYSAYEGAWVVNLVSNTSLIRIRPTRWMPLPAPPE